MSPLYVGRVIEQWANTGHIFSCVHTNTAGGVHTTSVSACKQAKEDIFTQRGTDMIIVSEGRKQECLGGKSQRCMLTDDITTRQVISSLNVLILLLKSRVVLGKLWLILTERLAAVMLLWPQWAASDLASAVVSLMAIFFLLGRLWCCSCILGTLSDSRQIISPECEWDVHLDPNDPWVESQGLGFSAGTVASWTAWETYLLPFYSPGLGQG